MLPFFYPDEFESFQDGYRFNRITDEDLTGGTPGQWRESWCVVKFEEILTALAALKKPCSLEAIAPLADLNNEFYRELADDYAQADEACEELEYKYFSVFIEDLGTDPVKTLVFLKKIFESESFARVKERAQNLPLCLFSGTQELAGALEDKLASLGG